MCISAATCPSYVILSSLVRIDARYRAVQRAGHITVLRRGYARARGSKGRDVHARVGINGFTYQERARRVVKMGMDVIAM